MKAPASNRPTALIVGAGIGGLAAGVALQRAGWTVRIFERAANPRELGFALLLAPNAISALRRLGLADPVIAGGARVSGGILRRADGLVLRNFDATKILELLPEAPVVVLRPVLHGELLKAVAGDALTLNSPADGFERREDGVQLRLSNGRVVDGDILIGADGVRSTVRRILHPDEPPPRPSGLFALRGVVHQVQHLGELRTGQYFGRGIEAGVAPAGQDAVYWYISLGADDVGPGSRDPLQLAVHITRRFDDGLRALVRATRAEDVRLDQLFDREPIRDWGSGRVTLLGDAAHPMLPHAGQGAAQALEDAVALGRVLDGAHDIEAALRRYERLRFDRTRRVMMTARRNARMASVRSAAGCWLRDLALRLIPDSALARSYVAFGTPPELG